MAYRAKKRTGASKFVRTGIGPADGAHSNKHRVLLQALVEPELAAWVRRRADAQGMKVGPFLRFLLGIDKARSDAQDEHERVKSRIKRATKAKKRAVRR